MGNAIEAATNAFKKHGDEDNNNAEHGDYATEPSEEPNEFEVTEELIQQNPLLALPSDILQIIVNEIDPDLTELAR